MPGLSRAGNRGGYPEVLGDLELCACLPVSSSKCFLSLAIYAQPDEVLQIVSIRHGKIFLGYKFSLITMSHHH